MRIFIVLLLLAATSGINAQQLLFDKTIPEQNVPTASRLKNEMRSHYVSSRYVSQTDFLSQQDFFIAITSNLIVKSKFIKMHSYPSGSFSYEGRLEGPVTGHITFSKFNDRTAGMIVLADGSKYMIDQVASNIFAISLSNEYAFTQRESHGDFIEVSGESQANASVASICDGNPCTGASTIDIMVVYTQEAENNWGGVSSTIANITQAVTNMNTSMSGSGINNVTFRLVHAAKVNYTESGDFSTDLVRLAGNGDGYMDNVHSLRDQYGADIVSLIIGSPASSCGIGYLNTNPSAYSAGNAFNVSLYSCVVGNFTMAHESGHNMGLRHDWYVDASTTPCSHQHGYVNQVALAQGTSSPSSSRWRTIMAYNDRCAVAGISCTRINLWSNPGISYNGDATGIAIGNNEASDEAYAFYRMACIVAAFRPEPSGGGGGGGTGCSAPSGLSTSGITTSSATANWNSVSGATSYDVDYKASSSGSWINIASGTTSLSWNLLGMPASTSFDWRVRANCSGGSSSYTQSQFTTQSIASCNAPSGLSTSNITTSSATANWSSVSGATSYDVDYKASSSGSWINIASGTTSLSWNLSGMPASTSFDWRVKANCSSGVSSYAQSQFATQTIASCNAPAGLSTSNITTSSATANWRAVSGATSYDVDYKTSSSGSWINIASGTTSLSWNLLGMPASTSFDWRVRANCSSGSSNYTQSQFTTQTLSLCNTPSGLNTLNITTSSATATWNVVSGANSYDVDYRTSSSGSWINIASGITSTSWNLLGMPASTSFDWRVRANCLSGSSSYAQTTFSTLSQLASCSAPTGLSTSGITASAASANWAAVSGATSYNVDYKLAASSSWINIANGTTSLSWTLSGMEATTSYDWRVRANCASGNSSYTQTQFTTQAAGSCIATDGLYTSSITSSTATVNWSSVSGAFSYTVEYKPTSSGAWITAASATYSTSVNLYSLSAATSYDWRVKANCSLSESSSYSTAQFATSGSTPPPVSPGCPGPYDLNTNGTIEGSAAISLNTDINGTIAPRNDVDHYRFTVSSAGTVTVSLSTLPANYNLAVLNSNGAQIGISQNNGTQSESITLNVAAGTYYAKVFPKGNVNNAASCYTLRVQTGTASDLPPANKFIVKLFPNPAGNLLNVWMEGTTKNTEIRIYDMMGKQVMQQVTANTLTQLNISKLSAGLYLLRVNDGKETRAAKFVKE